MTASRDAQITVALDPDAEVIGGEVRLAGQRARSFTGWIGLMSALGQVVESLGRGADAEPACTPPGARTEEDRS